MVSVVKMKLIHPFTAMVSGPTKAGKTVLVKNIVLQSSQLVDPPPGKIIWCYSEWQPQYEDLVDKVQFIEGIPDSKFLKEETTVPKLIILDDLMENVKKNTLSQIFTKGSHHWNISCIHIIQNLFYDGLRTSRVNAQYLFLLKNPSDKLQAMNLAKQIFPKNTQYFMEAYENACEQPHGYLLVDLNQNTPETLRLRTRIFPGQLQVVYVPKL